MFAKSGRVAVGAAVLAPIVSISTSAVHAATPPAPVKNKCIGNAVSAAEYAAGVRSVLVCFATDAELQSAISGGGGGPVTSAIGGPNKLATFWGSRNGDGSGGWIDVWGDNCNDWLYLTPDSWLPYMGSWTPRMCSNAKHYTGSNFSGQSTFTSRTTTPFDAPFLRGIRSIKFS